MAWPEVVASAATRHDRAVRRQADRHCELLRTIECAVADHARRK
jgi:hypothetical protein